MPLMRSILPYARSAVNQSFPTEYVLIVVLTKGVRLFPLNSAHTEMTVFYNFCAESIFEFSNCCSLFS